MVHIQPPIKINILKVTSGEINACVVKLLRMLKAKRTVKEKERVIPPWIFQLSPFPPLLLLNPTGLSLVLLLAACQYLLSSCPPSRDGVLPLSSRYLAHTSISEWHYQYQYRNYQYLSDLSLLLPPPLCPLPTYKYSISILTQWDTLAWFISSQP